MNPSTFSISKYPDVKEIYGKLDKLINQPIRPVGRDKMKAYLEYFNTKCPKSKEMIQHRHEFYSGRRAA